MILSSPLNSIVIKLEALFIKFGEILFPQHTAHFDDRFTFNQINVI